MGQEPVSRDSRLPAEREIIGALLKGGCMLFGRRIELAWPDGPPPGMDAGRLQDIGRAMSTGNADSPPRWIPAAARHCEAAITCGQLLDGDGKCSTHGQAP